MPRAGRQALALLPACAPDQGLSDGDFQRRDEATGSEVDSADLTHAHPGGRTTGHLSGILVAASPEVTYPPAWSPRWLLRISYCTVCHPFVRWTHGMRRPC